MTRGSDAHSPPRLALFEPEPGDAARIACILRSNGLTVTMMPDPAIALRPWSAQPFDLVLANLFRSRACPDQFCDLLRGLIGQRPLLALTSSDLPGQRALAIQSGADDAMAVTGDVGELLARLGALLRRRAQSPGLLACDELTIDLIGREVTRGQQLIAMPLREFDLLTRLARSADRVVTRHDLLRAVWRLDFDPGTNRIEVHMSRLRQRIDAGFGHAMLRTVKGSGYALVSRSGAIEMRRDGLF